MLGSIFFVVFTLLIFLLIYDKFERYNMALLGGFLILNAAIVLIAEVLSIINFYSIWPVTITVFVLDFIILIAGKKHMCSGISKIIARSKADIKQCIMLDWILVVGVIAVIVCASIKNITYPPQNYDSRNFHCVRAFLYWKKQSIHNMSYSLTPALYYYPPLNAILMSFWMVLAQGSDRLMNFVQMPSWVFAIYAVGGISEFLLDALGKELNQVARKVFRHICMGLMLCVPMALLQISTTQDDLLAASFGIIAVYMLLKILDESGLQRKFYCCMAGIAGGLAFLSKITCAPILIMAGSYFVIQTLHNRWKCRDLMQSLFIISIFAVCINLGHWIRNAVDLNGDFIGLTAINGMFRTVNQPPFLLNIIINSGYCFGSKNEYIASLTNYVVKWLGEFLYGENSLIESFNSYMPGYNHDYFPYAFHLLLVFFCECVLFVYSIAKKNWKIGMYIIACWIAWFINAGTMRAMIFSMRYLLPCLFMALPLVTVACYMFFSKNIAGAAIQRRITFVLVFFTIAVVLKSIDLQCKDISMPLPQSPAGQTYEELRFKGVDAFSQDAVKDFMMLIDQYGYTQIGIQEDTMNAIYPLVYQFRDEKFHLEYVNSLYPNHHEPRNFLPECIIYVCASGEEDPEVITYGEYDYKKISACYIMAYSHAAMYALQ